MTRIITAAELRTRLLRPAERIVDVRPLAAYNGWRLDGEGRGGHIPGAVAVPIGWLDSVDATEFERILDERGLFAATCVSVYGLRTDDAARMADRLETGGCPDVRVLDGGFSAWGADRRAPVEALPRHDRLVHVDWLRQLLAGGRVEAAPTGPYLLFHVNFGAPEEYAESHIPGALYLDTERLEDPADWNRRSPDALAEAVKTLGITRDTTVIVYGRDSEGDPDAKWPGRRAGQIAATRALMILDYIGVEDVRLLDGGYDWWVRAGHPLETTPREPTPIHDFGGPIPGRPEVIVDIDEAKALLADRADALLVSVRTWKEHLGDDSGYDYMGVSGRIKGDVWGNCGTDAYHMQHYRTIDNMMRPYPEIAANWRAAGITPDKHVAFYCGTGWRASEAWFYAHLQAWPRISVYDGGWFEWSRDPERNPIEVGEPA